MPRARQRDCDQGAIDLQDRSGGGTCRKAAPGSGVDWKLV
jgi:hypothetical protein